MFFFNTYVVKAGPIVVKAAAITIQLPHCPVLCLAARHNDVFGLGINTLIFPP